MLPKHYFKLTSTGSGDLLTTNRVSRQNVCVGGGNVSVFYVYVSCCNLSDKGALIDTFGRLGWERGTGDGASSAARRHKTSLCLATGYTIYTAQSTQHPANIIQSSNNCWKGSVTLRWIAKLPVARAGTGRTGFCGLLHSLAQQCRVRAAAAARGPQCKICFSILLPFELTAQQSVI